MKPSTPAAYANPDAMGAPPELEWIPVAQMFVDKEYQRSTETTSGQKLIETIACGFQWAKFQVIVVTRRSDGLYAVIDGQHRRAAAIKCGLGSLPCLVVSPESLAAEADIFVSVNSNRVRVQPYQMFWSKLAAGHAQAVAVKAVCDRAGITIPRMLTKGADTSHLRLDIPPKSTIAIAAIAASIRLHGEEITVEALRILADAFPDKGGQIRQCAIKGLGIFLYRQALRFDRSALVSALSDLDIVDLEGRAMRCRENYSNRSDMAMAAQIAQLLQPPVAAPVAHPAAAPPPKPRPVAQSTPQRPAAIQAPRPAIVSGGGAASVSVLPPIGNRIVTCKCTRHFRPEFAGQDKCNICRSKFTARQAVGADA